MNRSDSLEKFAPAFVQAQKAIKGARRSSVNPHFKSRYADLAEVEDACLDALNAQGIAVLQPTRSDGATAIVTTLLLHDSGEWVSEDLGLTAVQNTPQALGSAITYGRRYGLAAMVGVAPEDDDGEHASTPGYSVHPDPVNRTVTSDVPVPVVGAPTQDGGRIYVRRVQVRPTKNPTVKRAEITLSSGELVTTIRDRLTALAEQAAQSGRAVDVRTTQTKFGTELVSLRFADEASEPELEPSPDVDELVPF